MKSFIHFSIGAMVRRVSTEEWLRIGMGYKIVGETQRGKR
jgi:hypothetical protein